jgi:hypothetical protein
VKPGRCELHAIKPDGTIFDSLVIEKPVGVAEIVPETAPLVSVEPNPFFEQINIRFMIHDAGCRVEKADPHVRGTVGGFRQSAWRTRYQQPVLKIYDATGRVVRNLSSKFASGIVDHVSIVPWRGVDDTGCILPAGVYFVVLECDDRSSIVKVVKQK